MLQLTLPQGSSAVTPLQVANQTVDASNATQAQPYTFTTTLSPGPSSNWSSQIGVDACLDSPVQGAVPGLYGNGSSVLGYAPGTVGGGSRTASLYMLVLSCVGSLRAPCRDEALLCCVLLCFALRRCLACM